MKAVRSLWIDIRPFFVSAILTACMLGWVTFMAADNTPPYEYDAFNSVIEPSIASGGDVVTVRWKLRAVNRICPGRNRRILFDPSTRVVISLYDPVEVSDRDSSSNGYLPLTFGLPKVMPKGKVGYRAELEYRCNLFQKYVRPLRVVTPELFFNIE